MVEGGGFEPPKAEPADLQSDPFGRSGTPPISDKLTIFLYLTASVKCLFDQSFNIRINLRRLPRMNIPEWRRIFIHFQGVKRGA